MLRAARSITGGHEPAGMDAFSAGGDSDDGDGSWTADDPLTCSPSGTACDELFDILGTSSDCVDDGDDVAEHGYEREPQQRRAEIRRVRELLSGGAVSPHIRRRGASLVYHALIADHRHPPEMLRVVVEAGADVNAPIMLTSSSGARPETTAAARLRTVVGARGPVRGGQRSEARLPHCSRRDEERARPRRRGRAGRAGGRRRGGEGG